MKVALEGLLEAGEVLGYGGLWKAFGTAGDLVLEVLGMKLEG